MVSGADAYFINIGKDVDDICARLQHSINFLISCKYYLPFWDVIRFCFDQVSTKLWAKDQIYIFE